MHDLDERPGHGTRGHQIQERGAEGLAGCPGHLSAPRKDDRIRPRTLRARLTPATSRRSPSGDAEGKGPHAPTRAWLPIPGVRAKPPADPHAACSRDATALGGARERI